MPPELARYLYVAGVLFIALVVVVVVSRCGG